MNTPTLPNPILSSANNRGTHAQGVITRFAENTIDERYLVVKQGTAADEVLICGANDRPLGFILDEASVDRDPVAVVVPASSTQLAVAAVAISAGDELFSAASGKVTNVSAVGVYRIGIALTDAAVDGLVELDAQDFGLIV